MTALGLTLAGLAPGVVAAVVYWLGRCVWQGAEDLRSTGPVLPSKPIIEHIEALNLRAAMLSSKLRFNGNTPASVIVDNAIEAGDREALVALLQEIP